MGKGCISRLTHQMPDWNQLETTGIKVLSCDLNEWNPQNSIPYNHFHSSAATIASLNSTLPPVTYTGVFSLHLPVVSPPKIYSVTSVRLHHNLPFLHSQSLCYPSPYFYFTLRRKGNHPVFSVLWGSQTGKLPYQYLFTLVPGLWWLKAEGKHGWGWRAGQMTSRGWVQVGVPVFRLVGSSKGTTCGGLRWKSMVVGVREAGHWGRRCWVRIGTRRGLGQETREGGRRQVGQWLEQWPLLLPLLSSAVLEPDLKRGKKSCIRASLSNRRHYHMHPLSLKTEGTGHKIPPHPQRRQSSCKRHNWARPSDKVRPHHSSSPCLNLPCFNFRWVRNVNFQQERDKLDKMTFPFPREWETSSRVIRV